MDEQQPTSPRRRMQILQAIPDSERTDEEWDELNELEIMFAPGNRIGAGGEPDRRAVPSGAQAVRKRAARGPGAPPRKAQPIRKPPAKKPAKGGGRGGGGGNPAAGSAGGGTGAAGGGAAPPQGG